MTPAGEGEYRPGGKPFRLPASCINDWECPYNGYLSHIKRRRPDYPDTINTVFGTSFHAVAETAMKHGRVDPLFMERGLYMQFDRNVAKAKMPPADIRRVGRFRFLIPEVVSNAIELCSSCDLMRKPLETEKKHILRYRGWEVAVIIDLLMQDPDLSLHVYDWKTGQARNWDEGRDLTEADVDGDVQLTLYHIAVHRLFGRPPSSLNRLYPRDAVRLKLAPRGREHFVKLSTKMDAIVDCAEEFERTGSRELFPTNPSPDTCRFCQHKDICPDVHPDALKPPSAKRTGFGAKQTMAAGGARSGKGRRRRRRTMGETLASGSIKVRRPRRETP